MSLKLKDAKKGSDFVRPEPGTHAARCYAVIDLGTHTETGQFGTKTVRKLQVSWELPNVTHVFDEKKGQQPLSVHNRYNFVMGSKSKLQKHLQDWREKDFTEEELENFEVKNLIGKPCLLLLKENKKGDRVYTNIEAVSPLMKGQKVPSQVNPEVYYEITMGQNEVFDSLPEFLQNYILECEEWNSDPNVDDGFLGDVGDGDAGLEDNDDIPF